VLLCLKAKEDVALERSFTQLKQFYADTRCGSCLGNNLSSADSTLFRTAADPVFGPALIGMSLHYDIGTQPKS
jgi:hypothetical protein